MWFQKILNPAFAENFSCLFSKKSPSTIHKVIKTRWAQNEHILLLSKADIDFVGEAEMVAEPFKNSCRNSDRNLVRNVAY